MQWIGALLFIGTTTWIGFEWSHRLTMRPKQIRQLKNALQILEAEIVYSHLPLQDAFFNISNQIPEPLKSFFKSLYIRMKKEKNSLYELWENEIGHLMRNSFIGNILAEILRKIGRSLVKYDMEQRATYIQS